MGKIRIKSVIVVMTICFFLLPSTTYAQTGTSDISTSIEEEMLLFLEIPSVYTASKYEQKINEAPSSVSIITAEEIKKYGYRTLADIMDGLKGFYTTYDRNYHYLGIRGFSPPSDYNTRFLLLVDGVRMNDNVYDTACIGTDLIIDIDLIQRIEVIRGPSSSLYGTNAFFGVINIITKRGRDMQGFEVSGEAGTFETYKTRLSYGKRYKSGLEMILSGSYYESQGQDNLYYEEYDDPETNFGVTEDNDDDMYYSFFGQLTFHDLTLEGAYVSRKKYIPTGSYDTEFGDPGTFTIDSEGFIDLKYEHSFAENTHLTARLYYGRYYYDGDYVFDYAEEDDEEPYLVTNKDYSKEDWLGTEIQMTKEFLERHKIIIGGEYRQNLRQDQGNYDEEVYLDDKRDSANWGIFIQDEIRIRDGLIFNAGLRYDYFETFGESINPRLALICNPYQKTHIKLLYGSAFRSPNFYELYYHDGEYTQKAPMDLDPETIETYEIILEQYLGDQVRGSISGFRYSINDLITLTTDPEDELLVFRNVSDVEATGIEAELEGKWEGGYEGRISYTCQNSENRETGEKLTNSPRHMAKLNLVIPLIGEKLLAGTEVKYISRRKTISGEDTDGTVLANLTLLSRTLMKGLEISASVYNLFDEKYSHPGSEEHLQNSIEQDGRSLRIKLTWSF